MFVIVNAYRLAPTFSHVTGVKERVRRRLAASLAHSGVSVTVTSVTDFCAFMIGSATALPALSSFCQYAAIGIVMCYLLQVRSALRVPACLRAPFAHRAAHCRDCR